MKASKIKSLNNRAKEYELHSSNDQTHDHEDEDQHTENFEPKPKQVGHMFHFVVWKKSLDVRYIFNATVAFIIAIILQIYSVLMIQSADKADAIQSNINTLESLTTRTRTQQNQLAAYEDQLNDETNVYYRYINVLLIFNTLNIAYLFQNFQEKFYANLRGIFVPLLNFQFTINLVSTVSIIYFLLKYYLQYSWNIQEKQEQLQVKTMIDRIESDRYMNINLLIALLTGLQFARIIFALQISRIFGPMIRIIFKMLLDLTTFMFLYMLIFIIFTCAGQLMFSELSEYTNFTQAAINTFSQGLGDFDYGIFDKATDTRKEFGYLFLTVWLIVSLIMLLNFLIAILSTTYSFLIEHQNALYLKEVILLRQRYEYNKCYSNMVSAFTPFNIVAIVVNCFTTSFKSVKFNHVVLIVQYSFVGFFSCIFHFLINVLISPFAYFVSIIYKLKRCIEPSAKGCKKITIRIIDATIFIFFGLLILIAISFYDMIMYAWNL